MLTLSGSLSASSATISGNITAGTVNGRNIAPDGMNLDALQALTGVVAGSTNFGTGTFGSIISDNATIKSALQELETSIEAQTATAENYLRTDILLSSSYSDTLTSITLAPGIWMITSETTIKYDAADGTIWDATVVLGTASTTGTMSEVYTSGQNSATTNGTTESAITISLSKIATLTSTTTVSIFAKSSVAATVVDAPPSDPSISKTATAIHAIRVR